MCSNKTCQQSYPYISNHQVRRQSLIDDQARLEEKGFEYERMLQQQQLAQQLPQPQYTQQPNMIQQNYLRSPEQMLPSLHKQPQIILPSAGHSHLSTSTQHQQLVSHSENNFDIQMPTTSQQIPLLAQQQIQHNHGHLPQGPPLIHQQHYNHSIIPQQQNYISRQSTPLHHQMSPAQLPPQNLYYNNYQHPMQQQQQTYNYDVSTKIK